MTGQKPAGSFNRAAMVLEALAASPAGGAKVSDLARRTGIPRPSIYRVLDAMMAHGWIQRKSGENRYDIGPALLKLSRAITARWPIERVAAVELGLLARELGQTMYLDVQQGLEVVCAGRYPAGPATEVEYGYAGMRAPFGITPASMAMLARMPNGESQAILDVNMPHYRVIPGFSEADFLRCYDQSRRSNVAVYEAVILDRRMRGLGCAVCDASGAPVAGIGVTFPRSKIKLANGMARIAAAAGRIEGRLALSQATQISDSL